MPTAFFRKRSACAAFFREIRPKRCLGNTAQFVGSVGDAFSAICCLQIFRFTSSKPSKSAIASDEKFIRLRTNSFVRYCLYSTGGFAGAGNVWYNIRIKDERNAVKCHDMLHDPDGGACAAERRYPLEIRLRSIMRRRVLSALHGGNAGNAAFPRRRSPLCGAGRLSRP